MWVIPVRAGGPQTKRQGCKHKLDLLVHQISASSPTERGRRDVWHRHQRRRWQLGPACLEHHQTVAPTIWSETSISSLISHIPGWLLFLIFIYLREGCVVDWTAVDSKGDERKETTCSSGWTSWLLPRTQPLHSGRLASIALAVNAYDIFRCFF